jgi:hypothetical protein
VDKRNQINIAISADQIAANFVGSFTALPSLELATMPQTHKENQEGLNEGYYTHCSFRSATQAVPAETNPRSVLNRLFGKIDQPGQLAKADPLDRQMLDLVLGGAKDLRRKLPLDDQHKLDEYLDSLETGNKHSRENLPFIIAGKGGGTINTGRFLPDTKPRPTIRVGGITPADQLRTQERADFEFVGMSTATDEPWRRLRW